MSVRTERLVLRPATPAFAAAMAAFVRENDAHLAPWSPTAPPGYHTPAYWEDRFAQDVAAARAGRAHRMLFTLPDAPGVPIGWATLSNIVRGPFQACNLGYGIGAAHQGRGLMHEGLEGLIDHAFGELNLHRLQANYIPTNARSGAVLRRLGFKVEGYAYDYLLIDGRWQDHVLTALTNAHWRQE